MELQAAAAQREPGAHPLTHPVSRAIAWTTVGVLLVMAMLSYLDRQIMSLMVDPIRADLGISDFQMGLLQGLAFGLFYAIFGLVMGWLVDRFQRRWVIYLGVTGWSLATAACGLAGSFWQLLGARFAVGIGEASLSPAASSMIADLFPRHRLALAFSVFGIGTALGGALALALGGVVIEHLNSAPRFVLPLLGTMKSWQMIFIFVGLPGLLVALLALALPEPVRGLGSAKPAIAAATDNRAVVAFLVAHRRYFTCHFLGFGMIAILAFGWAAWTPVMVMRHFGRSVGTVGPLLGMVMVAANLPGFLWSGWIADRWFRRGTTDAHLRYYAYTLGGAGVLAALAFQFVNGLPLFLLLYGIAAFFLPFTGPAGGHLQIVTPPQFRGRVSALFGLVFTLVGMCLGPPVVGFINDFVFHDPARVNSSLAILSLGASLIGSALFAFGLKPARAAVASADAGIVAGI